MDEEADKISMLSARHGYCFEIIELSMGICVSAIISAIYKKHLENYLINNGKAFGPRAHVPIYVYYERACVSNSR